MGLGCDVHRIHWDYVAVLRFIQIRAGRANWGQPWAFFVSKHHFIISKKLTIFSNQSTSSRAVSCGVFIMLFQLLHMDQSFEQPTNQHWISNATSNDAKSIHHAFIRYDR